MKRSRVNPRSDRTIAEGIERRDMRQNGPLWCQVGPVLDRIGVRGGCGGRSRVQGLHERRKASAGGSKLNPDNIIPSCNLCNGIIEDCHGDDRDRIEDSELVVRREGPEWDALGARAWRKAHLNEADAAADELA